MNLEVVELRRIPDSSDVLGSYELVLDDNGKRRAHDPHASLPALRSGDRLMSTPAQSPQRMLGRREPSQLPDVLERVLDKGIVIAGDIQVSLLDIELLTIKLRLLVASADKAKEMGIDWWENDPFLKRGRDGNELEDRLRTLEQKAGIEQAAATSRDRKRRGSRRGTSTASFRRTPELDAGRASSPSTGSPAIVGRVDLAEFGEEPLRRNLEDRAWLEQAVAAHDGVLSGVVGATPLVPLRFGAVFRDEDGVREMLREREREFRDALERLRGHVELGVKVFLARRARRATRRSRRAAASTSCRSSVRATRLRPFRRRRSSRCARCTSTSPRSRTAPARTRLSRRSSAAGASRCSSTPRTSSSTSEQPEFTAAADDHGDGRLEVVVTGPWPAYNFVEPEDAE